MAEEHLFRRKPGVVKAFRCVDESLVQTPSGMVTAKVGNWIVTDVDGRNSVCGDGLFRATHEPVDEAGNVIPWPDEKHEPRVVHGFRCPACKGFLILDIREEK